jgi:hypothetical protein
MTLTHATIPAMIKPQKGGVLMAKKEVSCSWCSRRIMRRHINPNTGKPIANFFCDTSCKGSWQMAQREAMGFTKEWLVSEYVVSGKDANQIGREIGRDGKRVWEWLKAYGIKTRPRGHNADQNLIRDGSTFRGRKHSDEAIAKIAKSWEGRDLSAYAGNGAHISRLPKDQHPSWKGGITPERQAVYASPEWADAVKAVWARDKAICQRCGKKHNTKAARGTFHIHHIVSFQNAEKRCDPDNLVLLCKQCHYWVHSKKNANKDFIKEE